MAAGAMSWTIRDRGFGWKRLGLPRLERSDLAENRYIFGGRPIPMCGSGFLLMVRFPLLMP